MGFTQLDTKSISTARLQGYAEDNGYVYLYGIPPTPGAGVLWVYKYEGSALTKKLEQSITSGIYDNSELAVSGSRVYTVSQKYVPMGVIVEAYDWDGTSLSNLDQLVLPGVSSFSVNFLSITAQQDTVFVSVNISGVSNFFVVDYALGSLSVKYSSVALNIGWLNNKDKPTPGPSGNYISYFEDLSPVQTSIALGSYDGVTFASYSNLLPSTSLYTSDDKFDFSESSSYTYVAWDNGVVDVYDKNLLTLIDSKSILAQYTSVNDSDFYFYSDGSSLYCYTEDLSSLLGSITAPDERLLGTEGDLVYTVRTDISSYAEVIVYDFSTGPAVELSSRAVIYVDSLSGEDSNIGDMLNPAKSLSVAYDRINTGGTIVLQEGDGSSYGSLSISKNVNIQAAYGSSPIVGDMTITNAQGSFQGLTFNSGISVTSTKGAIKVTECSFENPDVGIDLNGVNYVTIAKNTFSGYNVGIRINNAKEVNITSNVFYDDGFKAIEVITVGRIDLWRNTIHGARSSGTPSIISDENLRIIYVTLTATNINNKNVPLPGFAVENTALDGLGYLGYDIGVNVVEGPSFQYGVDYVGAADGSIVSWDGYQLESDLIAGDILRIMYSEDIDPGGGEAIRVLNVTDTNSTIDSNIIGNTTSNIALGIFFNSALKIRYNNFFGSAVNYNTISTPTNSEGNFSGDPLYTNAAGGDFTLQAGSPDINAGDPIRWDIVSTEILNSSRVNIAPLDRDTDRALVNRRAADGNRLGTGSYTGDVGAYEYLSDSHTGDYYVDEQGYDRAYFGGVGDPFGTVDRGFDPTLADNDIYVGGNLVPITGITGGSNYGRYRSKNMPLSARALIPGNQTTNDVIYVTPTFPTYDTGAVYVDPDGSDVSGDGSSTSPYRTIGKAILDPAQNIIVAPGVYPQFTGAANKRLIGIPVTKTIPLGWTSYCNVKKTDWNTSGTVNFLDGYITFTGIASIDSWSAVNKFSFSGSVEAKASVLLDTDSFALTLTSDAATPDIGVVMLQKSGADLKAIFKFTVGGVSYTYINTISSYDFTKRIRVSVTIKNGKITASANSGSFSKTKSLAFTSTDNWVINLATQTTGTTEVHSLSINADSFTSTVIEVFTNSYTRRKIFAIQGNG